MKTASMVPFCGNEGCCNSVREVYRSVTQLRRIRGNLFFESLGLAQQLFVVGRPPTLGADVAGVAHELLIQNKVRFQQLLHFTQCF
jgi:hypothetical protein